MSQYQEFDVGASRRSVLSRLASPNGERSSPESIRQSFMVLLSMIATAVSGYYLVTTEGTPSARILLALIFAGWLALLIHTSRSAASARND